MKKIDEPKELEALRKKFNAPPGTILGLGGPSDEFINQRPPIGNSRYFDIYYPDGKLQKNLNTL